MTAPLEKGSPPRKRRARFYVHTFQKRYAIILGLLLFIYSLLLFGLASIAPYIPSALKLALSVPLEERAIAATQFLVFGQKIWLAIIALIVAAAMFSLYVTNQLAGPLYRLEQSARQLVQGNLSLRVRLRKGDELRELAEVGNEALANLERALVEIRELGASGGETVRRVMDEMRAQPSANQGRLEQLELALKQVEQIGAVLKRFRFSDPR